MTCFCDGEASAHPSASRGDGLAAHRELVPVAPAILFAFNVKTVLKLFTSCYEGVERRASVPGIGC
jgi:hypothetical protein